MSCGISNPFVESSEFSLWRQETQIQTVQSESFFPDTECAKLLPDVGCSYNACKGTEYSASAPSILYSQNNLNAGAQPCAISRSAQTCTFSALQIKAHTALKQGCLGEGNVPLPSPGKSQVLPHFLPE